VPSPYPPLHVTLARLSCRHGRRIQDRPCSPCVGRTLLTVNRLGEDLILATGRILNRADGFGCAPTPLVYERAVAVLTELVPLVLAEADRQDSSPFPPGCTGYLREDLDLGEQLLHNQPCPVHTHGCTLACSEMHTFEPGCQLHIPPPE
jgi:hypothetical protein